MGGGRGLNKWDGTTWTNILPNSLNHAVSALGVYNNELYVAGMSSILGTPYKKIAKYNGSTWSAVGAGLPDAFVKCMAVFNNELYVGGDLDTAGTVKVRNLAKWNGSAWSDVGGGANARVAALLPYGQNLYLSGAFWKVGTADISSNRAASWNGTSFTAMGGLTGGEDLAIFNGQLYGLGAMNVQRWTGTVSGLNDGETKDALAMKIFPSPSTGAFSVDTDGEINELSVYNLTGQKILSRKNVTTDEKIDVSFVVSGVYLIKVITGKGTVSKKLVIQN